MVTLGGAEPEGGAANATRGYEELWSFIEKARPLDTSKLQPFEGSDIKWQVRMGDGGRGTGAWAVEAGQAIGEEVKWG